MCKRHWQWSGTQQHHALPIMGCYQVATSPAATHVFSTAPLQVAAAVRRLGRALRAQLVGARQPEDQRYRGERVGRDLDRRGQRLHQGLVLQPPAAGCVPLAGYRGSYCNDKPLAGCQGSYCNGNSVVAELQGDHYRCSPLSTQSHAKRCAGCACHRRVNEPAHVAVRQRTSPAKLQPAAPDPPQASSTRCASESAATTGAPRLTAR